MSTRRTADSTVNRGFLRAALERARLVWRLLGDGRVSIWLKMLLLGLSLAYLLMPVDLLPDLIPVLGQLDDAAMLMLLAQLFIQLCPTGVVLEHSIDGGEPGRDPAWRDGSRQDGSDEGSVIDVTYRVKE